MEIFRKSAPGLAVLEKGTWKLHFVAKRLTVILSCPKCGKNAVIIDHTIEKDGCVHPSVVCPKDCGFHAFIKLEDWTGGERIP